MNNKMFEYRAFCDQDLLLVTPTLYKVNVDNLFRPTEENTITILQKSQIIAFIDISYYEEADVYSIDMFEVFDTGKGIGTQIIHEIQQCEEIACIEINPYSYRSIRFWNKMGFEFVGDETMQWRKEK